MRTRPFMGAEQEMQAWMQNYQQNTGRQPSVQEILRARQMVIAGQIPQAPGNSVTPPPRTDAFTAPVREPDRSPYKQPIGTYGPDLVARTMPTKVQPRYTGPGPGTNPDGSIRRTTDAPIGDPSREGPYMGPLPTKQPPTTPYNAPVGGVLPPGSGTGNWPADVPKPTGPRPPESVWLRDHPRPAPPGPRSPSAPIGGPAPATRSGPDMSGWAAYSKANYRPGSGQNIMQLRNNYLQTQQLRDRGTLQDQQIATNQQLEQKAQGGFSQGGVARYDQGGMATAGERLRNIQTGLRFANAAQMPPSARDAISGTVSALGQPPEDFWSMWGQGEPGGVNPNQGMASGFKGGGKIKMKRAPDGSFEYSEG